MPANAFDVELKALLFAQFRDDTERRLGQRRHEHRRLKETDMRKLLEEREMGTRAIAGTEWPIRDQLHQTGEREWTVTRELCNGTARSSEVYRSEAAAREAFVGKLDGRKPRAGEAGAPVTLRASTAERERWQAAAEREDKSLSEWLRDAAELAIARGSTR